MLVKVSAQAANLSAKEGCLKLYHCRLNAPTFVARLKTSVVLIEPHDKENPYAVILSACFTRSFRSLFLSIACTLLVVFCSSCRSCSSPDAPGWDKIISKSSSENSPALLATTNHLVIYLDTSGSMAGYISPNDKTTFGTAPDGQTVFSHTLQELRGVVTSQSPPIEIVFRRVDASVGSPSFNDLDLAKASINRSTYNGGETNLAGAINTFPEPLATPAEKGSEDEDDKPSAPARFHILITDGVQSTNEQRTNLSCLDGSDFICVKKRIFSLLEKGWAGIILGVRGEFAGKVYSEVNRGQAIPYESKRRDPNSFRPFYLYLFSPDREALNKLVDTLKQRLRPLLGQSDALREYALTAPYADGFAKGEIIVPKESADALEKSRGKEEDPARFTLRVDLNTEKSDAKPFDVKLDIPWSSHALDSGSKQELAGLLKWELVPVYPGEAPPGAARVRFPEVNIVKQETEESGKILLHATAQWPRGAGEPAWRAYRLEAHLNLEKQIPPWVQQWSTNLDTTAAAANKTLNLESSLSGLWRNAFLEKQVVAVVYLRVGPR